MQHNLNTTHDTLTPSPTSVPLPNSPQSSHGEFDALIELLGSDETPVGILKPDVEVRGSQTDLRNANGQLDFSKIKNMFASSNSGPLMNQNTTNTTTSQNVETGHVQPTISTGSVEISRPISPIRPSAVPTLNDGRPPAESTPIPTARALRCGKINVTSSFGPSYHAQLETDDVSHVTAQYGSESLTSPLLDLKQALDITQREVIALRKRCCELEDLHASGISLGNNLETLGGRSSTSPDLPQVRLFDINDSITHLRPTLAPDDIRRALEMVAFVDELVWKRSRFGAENDNQYGVENIQALKERLELWEHVIRTRR